jgi:hypothetical protein
MRNLCREYRPFPFIIVAAILFGPALELRATMDFPVEIVCPVCDTQFEASVLMSTNTFGGEDRDLLERAWGAQPVLIYPVTCPGCFYSGYTDDFGSEVKIARNVKELILENKVLKPIVAISAGPDLLGTQAWVKYDLIAQTYQLLGKDGKTIADQFLRASWAVRVKEPFLPSLAAATAKKVREVIQNNWDREEALKGRNPALYEIALGKEFARKAQASDGNTGMLNALAAIELLRSHGENTAVEEVVPILKTVMAVEQYAELERGLRESISCERHFQTKAVALFEKVIETGEVKQEKERWEYVVLDSVSFKVIEEEEKPQKAILTYLCGELHRRSEHWGKARYFYEKCAKMENLPEWLGRYVKEQKELLPPN